MMMIAFITTHPPPLPLHHLHWLLFPDWSQQGGALSGHVGLFLFTCLGVGRQERTHSKKTIIPKVAARHSSQIARILSNSQVRILPISGVYETPTHYFSLWCTHTQPRVYNFLRSSQKKFKICDQDDLENCSSWHIYDHSRSAIEPLCTAFLRLYSCSKQEWVAPVRARIYLCAWVCVGMHVFCVCVRVCVWKCVILWLCDCAYVRMFVLLAGCLRGIVPKHAPGACWCVLERGKERGGGGGGV